MSPLTKTRMNRVEVLCRRMLLGAGFGGAWLLVLLVPEVTRDFLVENDYFPVPWTGACMVATSVFVTMPLPWFRDRLTEPFTLILGTLLPVVGCLVYVGLILAVFFAHALLSGSDSGELEFEWMAMPATWIVSSWTVGTLALFEVYTQGFYVVVPMGFLHAFAATRLESRIRRRRSTW